MTLRFIPGNPFKHHRRNHDFIFHWQKPFFYLMPPRPGTEHEVPPSAPLPPNYIFVPKGDPYITRHCRTLTKSTGQDLFVVIDPTKASRPPLGLRVPHPIHATVLAANTATKTSRLAATAARDARTTAAARTTLLRLFPAVPPEDVDAIIAHAFRKGSGRVGRAAGSLSLEERVVLGVRAHVRHVRTGYEGLMREGVGREEARRRVVGVVEEVVRAWKGEGEKRGRRASLRGAVVEKMGSLEKMGSPETRRSPTKPRVPMRKVVRKPPVKRAGGQRRQTTAKGRKTAVKGRKMGQSGRGKGRKKRV